MAQVYSVNAVGYVNTTLKPGLNLVSNPLTAADNAISALFASVPSGTQVYVFDGTGFTTYGKTPIGWTPAAASTTLITPGGGVFVRNNTAADVIVTFVGEVPQGSLSNPLPAGLSIKSSQVPQAGLAATDLGFPAATGDQIYKWNGTAYVTHGRTPIGWSGGEPTLGVGEAVFVRKTAAGAWTRTFSVNG